MTKKQNCLDNDRIKKKSKITLKWTEGEKNMVYSLSTFGLLNRQPRLKQIIYFVLTTKTSQTCFLNKCFRPKSIEYNGRMYNI